MGNSQGNTEQKSSRRRFTIESSIKPPSEKEPFLFATEPRSKSIDV